MLSIDNLDKIVGKHIEFGWYVDSYRIIGESQYQFRITNTVFKTENTFSLQLERIPIGRGRFIYEIWAWGIDGNVIRKLVPFENLKTLRTFLQSVKSIVQLYMEKYGTNVS